MFDIRPATRTALLLALALALGVFSPARAEERIALVIGNADYGAMGKLKNPVNDSRLMAGTLRDLGFRVIELVDADQREMKRGVRDFGRWLRRAGPDGVALFYYAGHGVQVSGRNYLLPVEAQILAEGDVDIEAIEAESIMAQMQHANTGVNIVILDACRNNPFQQGFRSASRGLARMEAPTGTYIAYATAPGQLAMDGDGPNSPFTRHLAAAMVEPGISIEAVFKRVRQRVAAFSEERQIPWSSSSLIGDFVFNRAAVAGERARPAAPPPSAPAASDRQMDVLYWESIKDSGDPGLFREYKRRFPDGVFAAIADARLRALAAPETPPRRTESAAVDPAPAPERPPATSTPPAEAVRVRDCDGLLRGSGSAPPYCLEIRQGGVFEVSEKCGAISTRDQSDNRGREQTVRLNRNDMVAVSEIRIVHYFGEETRCYWIAGNDSDSVAGHDGWVIVIPGPELRFVRLHEAD
ncbi:caspase family protein [Minwuia thermotolerans]|uniref:Peptidase C14, caspase catalytic subunit p20 n=1 Tax=Minwuia thermotolerans TaxID=2056226 RepID=A0A2M9G200_9PROT|nr:caspase domain-containing protein [Minwuia thermotolerans]PJK29720.1 peptidase C14, caspase catalytic subunit p20 [Minwuia thermotolerans]